MKRIGRAVAAFAAFVVALCLTSWLIHESLPLPSVPAVQAKLTYLADHVNEYDTLFLGSSRIYHQIIPEQFDRLMAERGMPTRSFNSGVDGMRPPEDAYVFDQIRGMSPKNIRWVVLELAALRMPVDEDKKGTVRAVYWHDWERLMLLTRRAFVEDKKRKLKDRLEKLQEPLAHLTDHIALFVQNRGNIGRAEVLTHYLRRKRPPKIYWNPLGPRKDGFVITGRPEEMLESYRIPFERELAKRKKEPAREDEADPVSQLALGRMLEKIRSIGATPVLVVPPTTGKKKFVPSPEHGDVVVLDYTDVNKYAVLYENRYRLDTDHVNTEGAKVFTDIFVEEFAAAVARKND
ncbi:MAG: hypothetical protein ACO1QR_06420 [Chthoniobacteraceae bacterium]